MNKKNKPQIDAVTLNLVNKLKRINDQINEGAWEYIHIGDIMRLQDAFLEVINYYDLKHIGAKNDEDEYQQFWYGDFVCHTNPDGFDPNKYKRVQELNNNNKKQKK